MYIGDGRMFISILSSIDKCFEKLFATYRTLRRNACGVEDASSTLKLTESLEKEDIQLAAVGEECRKVYT